MQCAVRDKKYVVGQSFGYNYDDIGNLKTENRNGNVFKYTANSVNQYTERTVPSRINISGSAASDAKVTIKQASAGYTKPQRYGNYFNAFFTLDNSINAVTDSFDIYAVKFNGTKDIVAKQTLNLFIPKTPELFTYDDDGNLLTDGRFTYTWNAENRLISAVETGKQKIDFIYDYQGRRISKKVYTWTGSWTLSSEIKFVYDRYNIVAEYDGSNNLLNSYLWGEDLSGSLDGAGGVGGLLAVNNYLPVYDGNGNVMSYINAADGTVCAEYQYNPFGRIIAKSGTNADSFKMLFSTKYYDKETETFYYLYRDYKPEISRWLSRDPVEESGGVGLYRFVRNQPTELFDVNGLWYGKWITAGPTHGELTDESLQHTLYPDKMDEYPTIFKNLKKANEKVDSTYVASYSHHFLRIHRPYTTEKIAGQGNNFRYILDPRIASDISQARAGYTSTIKKYQRTIDHDLEKDSLSQYQCSSVLNNIGELTHVWQDYFAHAINKDAIIGGKNYRGEPGAIEGSPDSPTLIPVSWAGYTTEDEHSHSEPGIRANDYAERKSQTITFVSRKYNELKYAKKSKNMLERWWCLCQNYY